MRNVRSDGVTLQAIIEDLAGEENPIVSAFLNSVEVCSILQF